MSDTDKSSGTVVLAVEQLCNTQREADNSKPCALLTRAIAGQDWIDRACQTGWQYMLHVVSQQLWPQQPLRQAHTPDLKGQVASNLYQPSPGFCCPEQKRSLSEARIQL